MYVVLNLVFGNRFQSSSDAHPGEGTERICLYMCVCGRDPPRVQWIVLEVNACLTSGCSIVSGKGGLELRVMMPVLDDVRFD